MAAKSYTAQEIETLAQRIISKYNTSNKAHRFIVTVSGIPGAGKSTITHQLLQKLQEHQNNVALLPQDGFHYYRHELHQMKNPQEAIARRGAPFTYNVSKFVELIKKIKYNPAKTVQVPDFSHELKDPQENKISINAHHQIIIVEGNYVNLTDPGWGDIGDLSDEKWMVVADFDIVRQRLIQRHLEAGIVDTEQEGGKRVDTNDMVNGQYVLEHSHCVDIVIFN